MIHRLLKALCAALVGLCLATAALAQNAIDYDAWSALADRAASVLEAGQASDEAMETLRADIAEYRAEFLAAQSANAARVETLQSQIEALGPVPESGEEPDMIASRRVELNSQLATLRAPGQRAEEAYTQADGLIGEIDAAIRERQTDMLLELGPSPLSPVYWPTAVEDFVSAIYSGWAEVVQEWSSDAERAQLRNNLPLILLLLALALVLLLRGRSWASRLVQKVSKSSARGRGVWGFLTSLGQIVFPLFGLGALVAAADASGLFGPRTEPFVHAIPVIGATLLLVRWLAERCFSSDEDIAAVPLKAWPRSEAWTYFNVLSILLILRMFIALLNQHANFSPQTLAVLEFPILAGCALILVRLGLIMSRMETAEVDPETAETVPEGVVFRNRLVRLLGRAVVLVAIGGAIMSAVGYSNAGTSLIYPMVMSLFLAALLLVLQHFFNDVYEMIRGSRDDAGQSLIPVLTGFVLIIVALPIFALIWGARLADLTELWARFVEGVQLGDTRVSPSDFLTLALVFAAGYGATRILQQTLRNTVLPKTRLDPGGRNALVSGVGYLGIFLAALIAITATGLDLSSVAFIFGALGVGIGFGLQNIVQNFVSGIILLIERPISAGDWIEVGGQQGIVKDISVRSTRIETFDRTDVIVPNGDFVSGTVTNYTRGNSIGRVFITVGVAYGTDTRKVEEILLRIARENDYVLTNPEPLVTFARFGADALEFEVRAVLRDVFMKIVVLSEINHEIARRFAEEGIEIPFAQRDVWLRNPEALTGRVSSAEQSEPDKSVPKNRTPEEPEQQDSDGDTT